MKNKICLAGIALLLMIVPCKSFSQAQNVQKTPVKPALLVIDILNAFLPSKPENDRETAMNNINFYIQLFREINKNLLRLNP